MTDPTENIEHTVRQGRALVRANEALETIERLTFLERIVIPFLAEWYRRRLAYLAAAVPRDDGARILFASERIRAARPAPIIIGDRRYQR